MHSLRLPGEGDEEFRERAEQAGRFARQLIDACMENEWTQAFIANPKLPLITEEFMRRCPTVRVEFEQAIAFGGIGETIDATKSKHWGAGPVIAPLQPDDFYYPSRITYLYRENSLYNLRFEQRRKLKQLLGKKFRSLVTTARQYTKGVFLDVLTEQQAYVIRRKLSMEPGEFWRAVQGKLCDLPEDAGSIDAEQLKRLADSPIQQQYLFSRWRYRRK